jgi:hypothetical protein
MTTQLRGTRVGRHTVRSSALAVVAIIAALAVALPGAAIGPHHAVPAPPANPTSADQIQNLDQVKTAIKAYYGDTPFAATDPVTNQPMTLHTYSPTGAYVHEMAGLESRATRYLDHPGPGHGHGHGPKPHGPHSTTGTPAILLDVDDTTLNTYEYEIYSNFVYNPATNGAFVNAAVFPPVPGMPALVAHAAAKGYSVFFLTGRPESQRVGTEVNLMNAGYGAVPNDHLYLKDISASWLASCTPICTTTQYKSLTRQHIESLGYDIRANFGDQYSDLNGGFADKTFKVPNPMYYLP